ncbi:response regulator transcription factor [Planktotalea sp.]|uniref:response regulator transcription factor n=1 Tax=Planktotalea sp. TaxID=2029877 RepID=UPI003D6B6B57
MNDPVVADVGNVDGWVAWRDNYDLTHKAFKHCEKHGLNPERGHTFFFRLGEEPSIASIIMRPTVELTETLQDDLAASIITLCGSIFGSQSTDLALSEIQIDILMQIRAGKREKQIAHSLGVSIKTVQTHKRNIERSLRVETFHQAIIKATKAGIFD